MKKSLLSVVLCVALVLGAMSTMLAMPASALSGVDFLASGTAAGNEATPESTYSLADGVLTFTATAADQEVAITIEGEANLNDFPFTELVINSTAKFDIAFYDPNNSKWMFGAGDFCYNFNETLSPSNPLPAGDYNAKFMLTGAYTWTGDPLPANAVVKSITFIAREPGTITVSKCQMTDGIADIDLNSRGTVNLDGWTSTNLIAGEYVDTPAPSAEDPQSSIKVTKNDDGSVTYGNTNAQYPAAAYTFATPIVANAGAALELDFNVAAGMKTAIYVYMGPCTPSEFGEGAYIWVANPDDILTTDLDSGNYKGVIFLEDTINKTIGKLEAVDKCKNENGEYVINGIKVYAIGGPTDNAVTVNKLNLVAPASEEDIPETTKKEDRTTTALNTDATTAAGGSNNTTVNNGGSTGGNSANTADTNTYVLFMGIVAVSAVVTASAIASKKAKAR